MPGAPTPVPDDGLVRSINENGVLQPLVLCQNILCDGHRRLVALKQSRLSNAPCVEVEGIPAFLFAQLNSHRELNAAELAAAYANCQPEEQTEFLKLARCTDSPQLRQALSFISTEILDQNELVTLQLPINIWRELGHLGEEMKRFARDLLIMPGTVSEKRNIAMFLRQTQRKGILPDHLPADNAAETLARLQQLAQPRRTSALAKFADALKQNPLPPGFNIRIDETFSKQGMQLTCNLTRRHKERLSEAQMAVDAIFAAVDEL